MSDPLTNDTAWPWLSPDVVVGLPAPASIAHWARRRPQALAVMEHGTGQTYRVLAGNLVKAARFLRTRGVRPGMLVGLFSEQRVAHLILMLACEAIGAPTMSLGISDLDSDPALRRLLAVFCVDAPAEAATEGLVILTAELAEALGDAQPADAELAEIATVPPGDPIVRIVRTSGTTGTPKLIPISSAELRHREARILYSRMVAGMGGGYLTFYNFTSAAMNGLCAFPLGEQLLLIEQDEFIRWHDRLPEYTTLMVPALASTLATRLAELGRTARPGCIDVIGAYLPKTVRDMLSRHVATVVQSVYGSNETGRVGHVDTAGRVELFPGADVRIMGDDGSDCAAGETGAVALRVAGMFQGYHGGSGPSGNTLRDGWLETTDGGAMLDGRRFALLGRQDDMLNIGGIKVPPQPYEERFRTLPGVTDAVLIAVPDATGVERLLTVLEVADMAQRPRDVSVFQTMWPTSIGKVELVYSRALPRTATGKVRRGVLRDEWIAYKSRPDLGDT